MAEVGRERAAGTVLSIFPEDVLSLILAKLSLKELGIALCVSKAFHAAAAAPELWANSPLILSRGPFAIDADLDDKRFLEILGRAKGVPRIRIGIIDLAKCRRLMSKSLEGIVQGMDARALPPKRIDFSGCRFVSGEVVSFLRALDEKLAANWDKRNTRLWLMSKVYKEDVQYLEKFDTQRLGDALDQWPYDFKCSAGCENKFMEATFCSHCGIHVCECRERNCRRCYTPLCQSCHCEGCAVESESEVSFDSDEDFFDEEEDDGCIFYSTRR